MDKITVLNYNLSNEETIAEAKEFLGLSPEQSFQDLEIEEDSEED